MRAELMCSEPDCERSGVRTRDGRRYCSWHPTHVAPPLVAGGALDPKPGARALPEQQPVPAHLASTPVTPSPAWPAPVPEQLNQTHEGEKPVVSHASAHKMPTEFTLSRSAQVDPVEVARRYVAGEPLYALATSLHIGVVRLCEILDEQGVQRRGRGEGVGTRGPAPRPINRDEALRLYGTGLNSAQVAQQLGVKTDRVTALLREAGVLRKARGIAVTLDEDDVVRRYQSGETLHDLRKSLHVSGDRISAVLRERGVLRVGGRAQVVQDVAPAPVHVSASTSVEVEEPDRAATEAPEDVPVDAPEDLVLTVAPSRPDEDVRRALADALGEPLPDTASTVEAVQTLGRLRRTAETQLQQHLDRRAATERQALTVVVEHCGADLCTTSALWGASTALLAMRKAT